MLWLRSSRPCTRHLWCCSSSFRYILLAVGRYIKLSINQVGQLYAYSAICHWLWGDLCTKCCSLLVGSLLDGCGEFNILFEVAKTSPQYSASQHIWRLRRTSYGSTQAPRAGFKFFLYRRVGVRFLESIQDSSLFVRYKAHDRVLSMDATIIASDDAVNIHCEASFTR